MSGESSARRGLAGPLLRVRVVVKHRSDRDFQVACEALMFKSGSKGVPLVSVLDGSRTFKEQLGGNTELKPAFRISESNERERRETRLACRHGLMCSALSPACDHLLMCSGPTAQLLNIFTGRMATLITGQSHIDCCAMSCEGCSLVAVALDNSLHLIAPSEVDASSVCVAVCKVDAPIQCCAISPRLGREMRAAAADAGGLLCVWRLPSDGIPPAAGGIPNPVLLFSVTVIASARCCCCFANPTQLALGDDAGLRLWSIGAEASDNAEPGAAHVSSLGPVRQLYRDSTGSARLLLVADGDAAAAPVLVDAITQRSLATLAQHDAPVRHASFSRSGQLVLTLCGRDALFLSDAHSGARLHAVQHGGAQFCLTVGLSDDTAASDEAQPLWLVGVGTLRASAVELFAQELPTGVSRGHGEHI